MWEHEISKGSKLVVPATPNASVVLVLLSGSVEWEKDATDRVAPAFSQPLDGVSFYERRFSFKAKEDTRVLVVGVDHPESMRGAKPPPSDGRASTFTLAGGTNLAWADNSFGARIAVEQDPILQRAVASVTFLGIGSPTGVAAHVHENEWEMLAILSGAGTMSLGKGTEAKRIEVRPGSLVAIPKGTLHAFVPTELPVTAIQLYTPPGPEQRFKKLAAPGQ